MSFQKSENNSYPRFVDLLQAASSENNGEQSPAETDAELLRLFKETVPQDKFGEVSLVTALPSFRTEYNAALQAGNLEEFLSTFFDRFLPDENPLAHIYTAQADVATLTSAADQKIANNHQPENLDQLTGKLETMVAAVGQSTVPEAVKGLYEQKIAATEQFIKAALELGKPGFTREQQSAQSWARLLDLEATAKNDQVTMPYESQALTILENNAVTKDVYENVLAPLDTIWKLSESEKAALGYDSLSKETLVLTPEQGKILFELILARVGLTDWVVEWSSSSAIDVNAPAKKISFPKTREMSGDDIAYVIAHEMVHAIRGVNGAQQSASILESGMDDYLATEEGLATLSEMIVGQPFGHRRQAIFAGRYWAVAQALKVEFDSETQKPKAKFTMQEIYNDLISYNISPKDATEIIWRISRGTSLKREVVDLDISGQKMQVAETFTKDSVYFVGQMMLFNVFKEIMPLLNGENAKQVIEKAGSFSNRVLARIGRAIIKNQINEADLTAKSESTYTNDRAEIYTFLVSLGREALVNLLQYFIPGKMTLQAMFDPQWLSVLQRDSLTQYRDIFTATKTPTV